MASPKPTTLRFDDDFLATLDRLAQATHATRTAVIKDAVERFINAAGEEDGDPSKTMSKREYLA